MFYIVVNNNATEYTFDYISGTPNDLRLDPTIVSGTPKQEALPGSKRYQTFAIDLMSEKILSLNSMNSFDDILQIFVQNSIHHIPVIDNNKLMGLITTTNLHKKGKIEGKTLVKDLMESTVLCAHEDTPLAHILEVFIHEKIHSILVLDQALNISGILTQNDIFKWLLNSKI